MQLAVSVALIAALAGLARRRRLSLCWSFVPYAVAIIVCGNLATLWPSRFFNPEFWLLKQAIYDLCKIAIALELAWRVLRAFPGPQRVARRGVGALLVLTTALAIFGPPRTYEGIMAWQPRTMLGVAWLFTLTALIVIWYRLPVHLWHRALLVGFTVYLLAFSVLLQAFSVLGWQMAPWASLADGGAYLLLTWAWAVAAWRPERVPAEVSPEVLRRLGMEPR